MTLYNGGRADLVLVLVRTEASLPGPLGDFDMLWEIKLKSGASGWGFEICIMDLQYSVFAGRAKGQAKKAGGEADADHDCL